MLLAGGLTRHRIAARAKRWRGSPPGKCATESGEPEMKAFVRHSRELAGGLGEALQGLDADIRIAAA